MHGSRLFFPDGVDVFVQLSIHVGANTPVIVTEDRLVGRTHVLVSKKLTA
jgi:hypothetical protein